jgi:hypothetical protein
MGDKRIMNWKGFERKLQWPNFKYYSSIRLQGLRTITKNFIQCSWFTDWRFNPWPTEYKSGALTTRRRRSVAREEIGYEDKEWMQMTAINADYLKVMWIFGFYKSISKEFPVQLNNNNFRKQYVYLFVY